VRPLIAFRCTRCTEELAAATRKWRQCLARDLASRLLLGSVTNRQQPTRELAIMNRIVAASLATLLALPAIATAGEKQDAQVTVNTTSKYARGSLGSARNSNDQTQQIACYLSSYNNSNSNVGLCYAVDASGAVGSCSFYENAKFADIIRSMTSDSHVTFNWDDSYRCTRITVLSSSVYEPKK